jgi:predicted CoA-binding protein
MVESTRQAITDFLAQKRIAVVGASRNAKDFNTGLLRDLRRHGYDAVPVNPNATEIEGARCFPRVQRSS